MAKNGRQGKLREEEDFLEKKNWPHFLVLGVKACSLGVVEEEEDEEDEEQWKEGLFGKAVGVSMEFTLWVSMRFVEYILWLI